MARTVIGLFDNMGEARRVVQALVDSGFQRDDISIISRDRGEGGEYITERDERSSGAAMGAGAGAAVGGLGGLLVGLSALAIPGVGPVIAAGPLATTLAGATLGAAAGGIIGALTDLGIPEEEAHYYAEGVRRGGVLVSVETDAYMADRAAEIMGRYGAVDLDERVKHWRQEGWTHFDPNTGPYEATNQRPYTDPNAGPYQSVERHAGGERLTTPSRSMQTEHEGDLRPVAQQGEHRLRGEEEEVRVPVVEEQLEVAKRIVERGGVRLYTRVVERPVEETVRLRDEHVTVERRPVDRHASDADLAAFKEGTIEVTETDEEAVVSKRTRVVEEVVVNKEVEERSETLRDSARRTEVEVESLGADHVREAGDAGTFVAYETDFRGHYTTTLAGRGHAYEHWLPAYRYGYDLATDRRYSDRDWTAVEPEVRRRWEENNQGTWEDFKDTIRYTWDKVRGRR
jgi:uncharacterized protein (TIGR02271 family)